MRFIDWTGIAVALLLIIAPIAADGHGDAAWIMADPEIKHCCGPQDCRVVAPGEMSFDGQGWMVNGNRPKETYRDKSIDGQAWACFYAPDYERVRCLILPILA